MSSAASEPFHWTTETGIVGLGHLSGIPVGGFATSVSADGMIVVGDSQTPTHTEAFRWTAETGMVGLGDLPGGRFSSFTNDISADGTAIVGGSVSEFGRPEAFRWTTETGMVGLGFLPINGVITRSEARGVSADGSVIVGFSGTESISRAVVWNSVSGMQDLNEIINLPSGWLLQNALGISDDGSVIVGGGINPDGNEEAWMITGFDAQAAVPEPSTYAFVLAGILGLVWMQKRR